MKIIYTILFFTDAVLFMLLAFLLLRMIDNGTNTGVLFAMLFAISFSIFCLIFFLLRYLKTSSSGSNKEF